MSLDSLARKAKDLGRGINCIAMHCLEDDVALAFGKSKLLTQLPKAFCECKLLLKKRIIFDGRLTGSAVQDMLSRNTRSLSHSNVSV